MTGIVKNRPQELTRAELEIMQVLWNRGAAVVHGILDEMDEPKPAYNTVSTIVRILEKKGFVAHKAYGKTHEYYPVVSKDDYARLNNFQNTDLARLINLCKNKFEFRKGIKSIYPNFFFKEITLEEINSIDISNFPEQFIIKPTVGFLSMGVHKVSSHSEWKTTVNTINKEVEQFAQNFPKEVLSSSSFIVEEIIQGEEFAIDAYFDKNGTPVILNIFQHPFVSEDDVSDRAYISSGKVIKENLKTFEKMLGEIGKTLNIKNFPMHIEVIKTDDTTIVPVEINPMRFAGWCTTDLAYYAYGINIYEYFNNDLKPDWDKILADKQDKIYYFAMAETPTDIDKSSIKFDYPALEKFFYKVLDFRKIDYREKPLFAVIFGEAKDKSEITKILEMDVHDFV